MDFKKGLLALIISSTIIFIAMFTFVAIKYSILDPVFLLAALFVWAIWEYLKDIIE